MMSTPPRRSPASAPVTGLAVLPARRNRLAVLLATASAILILIGVAAGIGAWRHIRQLTAEQRKTAAALVEAQKQRIEAERQTSEARKREKQAMDQAAIADAARSFLAEDVLSGASRERLPDKSIRDAIVRAMLDPAAKAVATRFKDKPLVEAAVRNSLATTYAALGRADVGVPHAAAALKIRRRLLGEDHPHTLISINNIGLLLQEQGKLGEAEPLLREALQRRRRVLGDDHPGTLISINNMGSLLQEQGKLDQAEPLLREALTGRRKKLGPAAVPTTQTAGKLVKVLSGLHRDGEADAILKEYGPAATATQPASRPTAAKTRP